MHQTGWQDHLPHSLLPMCMLKGGGELFYAQLHYLLDLESRWPGCGSAQSTLTVNHCEEAGAGKCEVKIEPGSEALYWAILGYKYGSNGPSRIMYLYIVISPPPSNTNTIFISKHIAFLSTNIFPIEAMLRGRFHWIFPLCSISSTEPASDQTTLFLLAVWGFFSQVGKQDYAQGQQINTTKTKRAVFSPGEGGGGWDGQSPRAGASRARADSRERRTKQVETWRLFFFFIFHASAHIRIDGDALLSMSDAITHMQRIGGYIRKGSGREGGSFKEMSRCG